MQKEKLSHSGNGNIEKFADKLFSSKEVSGVGTIGVKRITRGKIARGINALGRIFSYSSSRSYGGFFLSFGLFTLFLNLGEYYFRDEPVEVFSSLITGFVLIFIAVPFMLSDKPICILLQDIPPTDYLFFEFFSIKRMHREYDGAKIPFVVAVILGLFPALLGFFVSVEVALITLLLLIFVPISMYSPEFMVIFSLLLIPYFPILPYFEIVLSVLSFLSFLSFTYKVIVGKRVFHFDIYTVLTVLLLGVIFIGGIIKDGSISFVNAVVFLAVLLAYFPAANIIVNRRLADCAIKAVAFSSVPICILAICEFITETFDTGMMFFFNQTPGISATFDYTSSLCAFLCVSCVLSIGLFAEKRNVLKKTSYFVIFCLNLICLILTMSFSAWLAVLICPFLFVVLKSKKIPVISIFFVFALLHLIFLIPSSAMEPIFRTVGFSEGFSETILGLKNATDAFVSNIWFGKALLPSSEITLEGANLVLGIGAELGIFALIIILAIIILRFIHLGAFRKYYNGSNVEMSVKITAFALIAQMILGVGEYIFADLPIFYLFVSVFGVCTSVIRSAKRENDDRQSYFSDIISSESSVIDITLSK